MWTNNCKTTIQGSFRYKVTVMPMNDVMTLCASNWEASHFPTLASQVGKQVYHMPRFRPNDYLDYNH